MLWSLSNFPKCTHHVFLSHSREDHDNLVYPTFVRLRRRKIKPWLDKEEYYYGRDSRTALKDGLLTSRHVVFFITDAMLDSPRGWCVLELAFTEIIQSSLTLPGGPVCNVYLPLLYVPMNDNRLPRSVWQHARDRGLFCSEDDPLKRIQWTYQQIMRFLDREQELAASHRQAAMNSLDTRNSYDAVPGMLARVTHYPR